MNLCMFVMKLYEQLQFIFPLTVMLWYLFYKVIEGKITVEPRFLEPSISQKPR